MPATDRRRWFLPLRTAQGDAALRMGELGPGRGIPAPVPGRGMTLSLNILAIEGAERALGAHFTRGPIVLTPQIEIDVLNVARDNGHGAPPTRPHDLQGAVSIQRQLLGSPHPQ